MELSAWRRWLSGESRVAAAVVVAFAIVWTTAVIKFQSLLVLSIANALGLSAAFSEAEWALYGTVLMFGVMVAPAFVVPWLARSPMRLGRLADAGVGLSVGLVGLILAFAIAALGATTSLHPAPLSVLPFCLGIIAILFQSGVEEIVFRGWIQPLLIRHVGPWIGIAAAAILFGLLHILAGANTVISVLNICLAGALFGFLGWRTGGVLAPIAAHFAWNWAESALFGLYPNPGVDVWGAFLNFDLGGAPLWSGGDDGLNGSLADTIVLLALCIPFALWRSKPQTARA